MVGVVGSRRASEGGRACARILGRRLAETGYVVVSGGALGIDAAALEGALDGGGRPWVVLPVPLDAPSPTRNLPLFRRIVAAGGGMMSEYTHRLGRHAFAERNRIIAALSVLVVVVEARSQSGTRHTVAAARRLGRPVLAYRWPPGDPRGEGGQSWPEAEGVEDADRVLARLAGAPPSPGPLFEPTWALRSPAETEISRRLEVGPARREELPPGAETDAALLSLELEGLVDRRGGRYWWTGTIRAGGT